MYYFAQSSIIDDDYYDDGAIFDPRWSPTNLTGWFNIYKTADTLIVSTNAKQRRKNTKFAIDIRISKNQNTAFFCNYIQQSLGYARSQQESPCDATTQRAPDSLRDAYWCERNEYAWQIKDNPKSDKIDNAVFILYNGGTHCAQAL